LLSPSGNDFSGMTFRSLTVVTLLVVCGARTSALDSTSDVQPNLPSRVDGVELQSITGWFANLYPWRYIPSQATVFPVPRLWTPKGYQSPAAVREQSALLDRFGSGADVLEYNPNPEYPDHNQWLSTYFRNGRRPFFLLYEHINGTRYVPEHGAKNMDVAYNRQVFRSDIDFMVRNVILPYRDRYVTHDGRAVIFMWSPSQMHGDLASLLDEVREKYPVMFIGSPSLMGIPPDAHVLRNLAAFDGFMEYGMVADDYMKMVNTYREASARWRRMIDQFSQENGRKYLFIPTFQAAFDDSRVDPPRSNPQMYPRTRADLFRHAAAIKADMGVAYDHLGPFVVFSEFYEGAAVIESECLPQTRDLPNRYVGCGTARLEILNTFFPKRSLRDSQDDLPQLRPWE
jgi:hypothetical protein